MKVLREKPRSRAKDGCTVYGLYLEGCRWGGNALAESYPKELYTGIISNNKLAPIHSLIK